MPIEWKKRCRKEQTLTSDTKVWETRCGKYRVVFSHIRYGNGAIPDVWYAMEYKTDGACPMWDIISKHRKKHTAERAVEKRAKEKEDAATELQRMADEKRAKRREYARKYRERRK